MKKALLFLLLLVALGCRRGLDSRVALADSLMWERPDSALSILESIDTASLTATSDRVRYALLLTQARHKNDIYETDDSLITSAVSYYETHGPDSCRMLSLFYHAVVLENSENRSAALGCLLPALDIAIQLKNIYWMARVHDMMGDIYLESINVSESNRFYRLAANEFKACDKKLNEFYSLTAYARGINHLGEADKAIELLDSIRYNMALEDSVALGVLEESYIRSYMVKDDYKSALAAHERGMKYLNGYTYEIVDWMDVATVHFALGNKAEAQYAFDKGVEEVNVPSQKDHLLYSIYKRDKEYEKALASLEKVYEYACKAFTKSINQNFQTVHKNYYNDKLARETREKRNLSIMSLVVICALIILIVAGTLIFRLTIKAKKKSLELQAFHIRELLAELENKARDITHLTIRNDESAEAVTQLSKELDSKEQYIETVRCLFNEQLEKLKKICANVIGGIDGSENTDLLST